MQNNLAFVTVIIPCWRCKETISRAIESVYKQTLLPEKVILIDDASGDGTGEFLERLALGYPNDWIEVIHLAVNSGPGVARNAGWDMAKTEYIAFLDADDAWHPQKIELQYGWMSNNNHALISGHTSELYNQFIGVKKISNLSVPKKYCLYEMIISNRMITRTVMIKRSVNYRFKGKETTEDYLLWLEMITDGVALYRFDEPMAVSFRAEFSEGGYSGNLWKHELREIDAIIYLYKNNKIRLFTFTLFVNWSIIKYFRRLVLRQLSVNATQ